jgi:tetratricopeptide (TPR) repeat protein
MNDIKGPKRGPQASIQWMLQIEGGRTLGPLKTEDVIYRISEGILSGNEKIKKYPDGQWTTVSREPVFYDELLKVLEQTVERNKVNKIPQEKAKPESPPEPTKVKPVEQMPPKSKSNPLIPLTPILKNESLPEVDGETHALVPTPKLNPLTPAKAITTVKPAEVPKKPVHVQKKSSSPLAGILFIGALVLGALAYYSGDLMKPKSDFLKLRFPRPTTKVTLSEDEQRQLLRKAYALFLRDEVDSYLEAQNVLVRLIEGNSQAAEPRGLLCIVHKELWPFAKQDSKDIDIFQASRKGARLLDPVGENGIKCEISYLIVLGKYKDAMGLIDHIANRRAIEASPIIFSLKAELLASDKKYKDAIAWALEAAKIWPQWAKAQYQTAFYLDETSQTKEALERYGMLFTANPQHRLGLIDYGAMMYTKLKNEGEALKTLQVAISGGSRIAKSEEAKAYYYLGRIYADKKNMDKALDYAEKSYQFNPGDLKARDLLIQLGGSPNIKVTANKNNELIFLGDQYYRAGDCLSAQAEYKAAFDLDPSNALAATKAARCLWQLSQVTESFAWLNKAIAADRKLSWPYYLMADYYSQRYNFQAAVQVLNNASGSLQNNSEILRGYGLIELRRNNFKDAIAYLERAKKAFDNDVETLTLLAKAYTGKSSGTDYEKAMQMAVKAIELEDTNPEAHVAYAKILVQTKNVDQGANYLIELVKKYSYTLEFKLGLADIYRENERYRQAQDIYEQVLLFDDRNKAALMGLAESYQGQALLTNALKLFLKASLADPADPEPLVKAGLVYMDAGRYGDAIIQFERSLKVNPNYPRVHYLIGRTYMAMKNYSKALEAGENEKKMNPNVADSYILAGEIYMLMNQYSKCATEYQMAIKLRPKGADNYVKLAICHLNAGNIDIAESMLNLASAQESGFPEIYKIQGNIFEKRADNGAAVQAYSKYLSLLPNAPDKKTIEQKIDRLSR